MHINTMGKTRPLCKKKSGQSWTAHEVCHCIEACCYFSGLATENSRWRPFRTPPLEKGSHFCIHHENILDLTPTQDDRHIHEFFSLGVPDPLKRHHPGVDETSQHLILGGGGWIQGLGARQVYAHPRIAPSEQWPVDPRSTWLFFFWNYTIRVYWEDK